MHHWKNFVKLLDFVCLVCSHSELLLVYVIVGQKLVRIKCCSKFSVWLAGVGNLTPTVVEA